jgi:exo-beta-1,3-glucanase (GH17 family)
MAGADSTKTRGPWPQLERVEAICYSGYREGQSPATRKYPSEAQVLEDLRLLAPRFRHLRMYDCSPHVQTTLALIQKHKLPFKVMIGAYLAAEASNPKCPWGGVYEEDVLVRNRRENQVQLAKAIMLANKYPDIVSSVSAGNEATVEWTDHLVPVEHVIQYVRTLKAGVKQPVTFCENYVPWQSFLAPLVAEVDFISLHTYPEWEQKGMDTALSFTEENFDSVAKKYPGKKVVITEAGWATRSSGGATDLHDVLGLTGFDIIGFDPRGVGLSGGLYCQSDSDIDKYRYPDTTPDDDAEKAFLAASPEAAIRAIRRGIDITQGTGIVGGVAGGCHRKQRGCAGRDRYELV